MWRRRCLAVAVTGDDDDDGNPVVDEAATVDAADTSVPATTKKQHEVMNVIDDLRKLQAKKPTLEVLTDVLTDGRVKYFSWVRLVLG